MLPDAVEYLRCPHCHDDLALDGTVLSCANGHAFDVARQGHVSLLRGAATFTGDTAAMVEARTAFLGAGHYEPIARALTAVDPGPGCVVDLGAGTGHYLSAVLDALPGRVGLALDASKNALRRAARAHPRIGAVVCDAWQPLPVRTDAAGLVLNVFAPRNPAELHRVLAPGGHLAVVAPTPAHLGELVSTLDLLSVGADKQDGIDDKLGGYFAPVDRQRVEFRMALSHRDVEALVGMGPNAFHDAPALAGRIAALAEPVEVTGSVTVTTYAPG